MWFGLRSVLACVKKQGVIQGEIEIPCACTYLYVGRKREEKSQKTRGDLMKEGECVCLFVSRLINLGKLPQHGAMNYPLVTTKRYQLKRVTKTKKSLSSFYLLSLRFYDARWEKQVFTGLSLYISLLKKLSGRRKKSASYSFTYGFIDSLLLGMQLWVII